MLTIINIVVAVVILLLVTAARLELVLQVMACSARECTFQMLPGLAWWRPSSASF